MTYRSSELDPTIERDIKENMHEKLVKKYGMTIEQAKANTENMVQMAKEYGMMAEMTNRFSMPFSLNPSTSAITQL